MLFRSPFIESLTGISNAMVADAPTFNEIAVALKERLDGKLLIAHNARFDYGFLKNEFARLDMRYSSDLLCTVKLSRKLYPGHSKHNLDTLMERHNVQCEARHRALGDARVLWDLLQIWRDERGDAALAAAALGHDLLLTSGGVSQGGEDRVREAVMEDVRRAFRPEFLNRLDEILLFSRLSRANMTDIVEIQLKRLRKLLADRKVELKFDNRALQWLANRGYDPVYGARPLKRVIQRSLQNPLATLLLEGKVKDGDTVEIGVENGELTVDGERVLSEAAD